MIEIKNVSKAFSEQEVLKNFSARFSEGITVITGPSGRGKTTLLRLIMGLEKPDAGEITGVPARLSAVFQDDRLPGVFRAASCVSMTARAGVSRAQIEKMLARLGLTENLEKPVSDLSGGERRRVALARALLADCDALILDEPFTGLDAAAKAAAAEAVREYGAGKIVLAVTHDSEGAALLGGQTLEM